MKSTIAMSLLLLTRQSYAGSFYYDSTLFQSDTSHLSKTFNDLESLVGTPQFPQNYPSGSGSWTTSDYGLKIDSTRFVGRLPRPTPETYILGDDVGSGIYALDGHYAMLLGREYGDIYFDAGVYSFSANYGLDDNYYYDFPGPLYAEIFYRDGTMGLLNLPINYGSTEPMFFGILGNELERITFTNLYRTPWDDPLQAGLTPFLLLDNIESGTTSAVPEPASGIGLCLSFGFLHCISRRRLVLAYQDRQATDSIKESCDRS